MPIYSVNSILRWIRDLLRLIPQIDISINLNRLRWFGCPLTYPLLSISRNPSVQPATAPVAVANEPILHKINELWRCRGTRPPVQVETWLPQSWHLISHDGVVFGWFHGWESLTPWWEVTLKITMMWELFKTKNIKLFFINPFEMLLQCIVHIITPTTRWQVQMSGTERTVKLNTLRSLISRFYYRV